MVKILFVCHGNICRSAMAEYVMKQLIKESGDSARFTVASAATSTEELGNPVYPPAYRLLKSRGIPCDGHRARQITPADYAAYDLLIGMDNANLRNMRREFGGDPENKLRLLSEYGHFTGEVADPWYTRDFELTYRQVDDGCRGLLKALRESGQ